MKDQPCTKISILFEEIFLRTDGRGMVNIKREWYWKVILKLIQADFEINCYNFLQSCI